MKTITFALFALLCLNTLNAQNTDFDALFKEAYVNADASLWESQIAQLTASDSDLEQSERLFEVAKARYYATSAYMAKKDKKQADTNLAEAETALNQYLKSNPKSGEAHALLSAIYGLQIGLSPMKGMTLGGKSAKHLDKALKYAPNDPFVLMLKGSNLYYTPAMWGGDSKEALTYFNKAKTAFEAQQQTCSIDWLQNLALLGQAYHYEEQYQDALLTYQTALKESSNFGWVKYNLLPKLEKEM